MRYLVRRRIMWPSPAEEKKRRSGKPFTERTVTVGKTVDEKKLAGANIEWLVSVGALEPYDEGGDE